MAKTKILLIRNVIHGGRILEKGVTLEVEDKTAEYLIEMEHAREHKAAPKQQATPPVSRFAELMQKPRTELVAIINEANKETPGSITVDPVKASNQQLVEAILKNAGYNPTN